MSGKFLSLTATIFRFFYKTNNWTEVHPCQASVAIGPNTLEHEPHEINDSLGKREKREERDEVCNVILRQF
jgi:hypothetical protein